MIVTKKKAGPMDTWKPMWEEKNKGMKIVATITFSRTALSWKERRDVAAFISWLLVAKHDAMHPSQINGWRRQEFGLFLIIAMIKQCYAVDNIAKTVEIYLQAFEPSAINLYTMLGFQQLNNHYDDGFGMLPRHVKDHLSANKSEESKISIFHANDKVPKSVAYQLMHLRSGCLRHFKFTSSMDKTQSLMKDTNEMWQIWWQFPPPRVQGIRLHYSDSTTMRQLLVGLPLLKALLPLPFSSMPLLTTMFVKGKMTIERCLAHAAVNGIKWMSSGKLDLMAAIVLFDGRFHNFCFVMPDCLCVIQSQLHSPNLSNTSVL